MSLHPFDLETFSAIANAANVSFKTTYGSNFVHTIDTSLIFDVNPSARLSLAGYTKEQWLYIRNPDGTIRWIWPATLYQALYLDAYNTPTVKSKAIAMAVKTTVKLGLGKLIADGKIDVYCKGTMPFKPLLDQTQTNGWGLFTGTVGPKRKLTLVVGSESEAAFYIKLPTTLVAFKSIQNEVNQLELWEDKNLIFSTLPQWETMGSDLYAFTSIRKPGMNHSSDLANNMVSAVAEWYSNSEQIPLHKTIWYKQWRMLQVTCRESTISKRYPVIMQLLDNAYYDLDPGELVVSAPCHGDFTPWNVLNSKSECAIYDWEEASEGPLGYDLIYYIVQSGTMIKHLSPSEILNSIQSFSNSDSFSQICLSHNADADRQVYLTIVGIIMKYMALYSKQDTLHPQAEEAIQVWSYLLAWLNPSDRNQRLDFIKNMFIILEDKPYAWMKPMAPHPFLLPQKADIDLCMNKVTAKIIIDYCANHPGVNTLSRVDNGTSTTISIKLENGDSIYLDIIHKFRRKYHEYLNADEVIQSAQITPLGIKKALPVYEMAYTTLFYWTNSAVVPSKHVNRLENWEPKIFQDAWNQLSKQLNGSNDFQAFSPERFGTFSSTKITKIKIILAFVEYYLNIIKRLCFPSGITLTISGVDGAGKSTVLKMLKSKLEEERYQVIVLRHRPSIFPIISAWFKGKKAAEAEAAIRLPRQGSNNSVLLSIPRYAYYLLDYLIGYWIIRIKYLSRGYIVLYDRYYFDFIADPKRSNILLPGWITTLMYTFVHKPELNIFLFAGPDVILKRKQELSYTVIEQLTSRYQSLFNRLASKRSQFLQIENISLLKTVDSISNAFQSIVR
jgi:thymidylate kinase